MFVIVEYIPVVLRWMSSGPAPLQIALSNFTFCNVLSKLPREETVELALVEGQVPRVRSLLSIGVVEDGLLVFLAPAVAPPVVDTVHFHPVKQNGDRSLTDSMISSSLFKDELVTKTTWWTALL